MLAVGTDDADGALRSNGEDEVFAGQQGVVFNGEGERDVDRHEALANRRLGQKGSSGEYQANTPKLEGIKTLLANCLAHRRRQFVEVAENFPQECRHVLEALGNIYHNDALAREQQLSPEDRLRFHQVRSGPVMNALRDWMNAQFAEHKTEPNSGLGKAISYLLNHWTKLTLFLSQSGAH